MMANCWRQNGIGIGVSQWSRFSMSLRLNFPMKHRVTSQSRELGLKIDVLPCIPRLTLLCLSDSATQLSAHILLAGLDLAKPATEKVVGNMAGCRNSIYVLAAGHKKKLLPPDTVRTSQITALQSMVETPDSKLFHVASPCHATKNN